MKNLAIIMSGGIGLRVGAGVPKQMLKIGDRSLLEMTLLKFHEHKRIDDIYVVSHRSLIARTEEIRDACNFFKIKKIITGGETRQISAREGVNEASEVHDNILIHDSARPFITSGLISRILDALEMYEAVSPAIASPDTLVRADADGQLLEYLDRDTIKRVQTPQGFKRELIVRAHLKGEEIPDRVFTDDCSMISHFRLAAVHLIDGDPDNIKITVPEDIRKGVEPNIQNEEQM